jgi:hypothetical protein
VAVLDPDIRSTRRRLSGVTATNLPPGFVSLSYSNTAANLSAALNLGGSPGNPQHAASAINGFFNNGGTLPSGFLPLFNLTGGSLNAALACRAKPRRGRERRLHDDGASSSR